MFPTFTNNRKDIPDICCGKVICGGCLYANAIMDTDEKCPFCRTPSPDSDEANERVNKRIEVGDPIAMHVLACDYQYGDEGRIAQDYYKALKLWHRAAELGHTSAYNNTLVMLTSMAEVWKGMKRSPHITMNWQL